MAERWRGHPIVRKPRWLARLRASGRLDQVRVLAVERVGADGGWLIVADPDRVRRTVARLHVPRLHW